MTIAHGRITLPFCALVLLCHISSGQSPAVKQKPVITHVPRPSGKQTVTNKVDEPKAWSPKRDSAQPPPSVLRKPAQARPVYPVASGNAKLRPALGGQARASKSQKPKKQQTRRPRTVKPAINQRHRVEPASYTATESVSQPVAMESLPQLPPETLSHQTLTQHTLSQHTLSQHTLSQPIPASSSFGCDAPSNNCCDVPLGHSIHSYFDAHILNGRIGRQVLYHYDFNNVPRYDRSQLNSAGRRKIRNLLHLLHSTGHPLVVQRVEGDRALSTARRASVLQYIQSELGQPLTDGQVIVGDIDSPGIRGVEAMEMDRNRIQNTRTLGYNPSRSGTSSSSSGNASSSGQSLRR